MRELKFRAWDKKQGCMCKSIPDYFIPSYWIEGDCIVMQYTGLKDKNGKEIYEGDVCLLPDGEKRFVRYDAPSFYLAKSSDLVDVDAFSAPGIYEEVIGNIYENPELITNNKVE